MAESRPKLVHVVARPYDAELMRRALEEAGYPAAVASWGSSGCEQVERERPAAVVLSTRRAEEECARFLEGLRAGDHGQRVPVVMVVEPGSRLASAQLAADRLLLRPLDVAALVAAVRALAGDPREVIPDAQAVPSALDRPAGGGPSSAAGQALREGSLRESDAARLIAEAHRTGFSGQLRFQRAGAEKIILFDAGTPVFATSNQAYDRLGDLLFREGKITREQYRLCDEGVTESGRRLGAILVDRGLIKARELFPLVRRQVSEIIYSVFSWTEGSYKLEGGEVPADQKIRLEVPTTLLVLEGIRRKYSLDRLHELVGPPETCLLALPSASALTAEAELSPAERTALELMDGRRSLGEIRDQTRLAEQSLYQLAHAASVLGVVTRRGAGEVRVIDGAESVPEARQREHTIDRLRVEAKYAQVLEADYFTLLGVPPDASSHEILRAYQRAREEFSPETFAPEVREVLAGQLKEIGEVLDEAFQIIGDEELRRSYREGIT